MKIFLHLFLRRLEETGIKGIGIDEYMEMAQASG